MAGLGFSWLKPALDMMWLKPSKLAKTISLVQRSMAKSIPWLTKSLSEFYDHYKGAYKSVYAQNDVDMMPYYSKIMVYKRP